MKHERTSRRRDDELPEAVALWGWRFHHLGIPTEVPRVGEDTLDELKVAVSGFRTSPYGVEWMRFGPGCQVPELVRRVPHVAFLVDDLDAALAGKEMLIAPNSPSAGVRVAFIVHDGAPVELLELSGRGRYAGRRGGRRLHLAGRTVALALLTVCLLLTLGLLAGVLSPVLCGALFAGAMLLLGGLSLGFRK